MASEMGRSPLTQSLNQAAEQQHRCVRSRRNPIRRVTSPVVTITTTLHLKKIDHHDLKLVQNENIPYSCLISHLNINISLLIAPSQLPVILVLNLDSD